MHGKLTSDRAAVYNRCHDYPVSKDDYGRELLEADPDPDDPSDDGPDQAGAPFGVTDVVKIDIVGPANGPTS
jgi:hypothetical protein